MAKQTNLQLFIGTDFSFQFVILDSTETAVIDVSTWAMSFMIKQDSRDADAAALFTETAIVVTGTYNSDPAVNTQLASVVIEDTDTTSLVAGSYFWELKRTDSGIETILAYGQIELIKGVHA